MGLTFWPGFLYDGKEMRWDVEARVRMCDEELMEQALLQARLALQKREVPVGAVIAKDGEIVAMAHNLRETGKNAIAHAELLAIDRACRELGGWRLWQCELFVTLEPCPMCAGAIINSRLKRVVYGAADPKAGCCGSVTDLFGLPFNHRPTVEGGLLEVEAAALLQEFFVQLRQRPPKEKWNANKAKSMQADGERSQPRPEMLACGDVAGQAEEE